MIDEIKFSHLNSDVDPKDLQPGEFIDAKNLLAFSDGPTGTKRRKVGGTAQLGIFSVSVNARCIGAYYHKPTNKGYFAFFDPTNGHGIFEFTFQRLSNFTSAPAAVLINKKLNFDPQYPVEMRVINGLLYFNDFLNNPRKINIVSAKSGLYDGVNFSEEAIAQIKKHPSFPVVAVRGDDYSTHLILNSSLRRKAFQFALRYVYLDNEVTELGPTSRLVPQVTSEDLNFLWNVIGLSLKIDFELKPFLDHVELIVREGNTGNWYIYDKIPISSWPSNDVGLTYYFYNDKTGAALSDLESIPLYQSFPRVARTMELHQDRLFEPDSLSDYNPEDSGWNGSVSLVNDGSFSFRPNDVAPLPIGFLGKSKYGMGIIFKDRHGRVQPVQTKSTLFFDTPVNTNQFTIQNVVRSWQSLITATLNLTGIPPSWAYSMEVVRTKNLTYDWWYATKCLIRLPLSDQLTTLNNSNKPVGTYIEDGYLYQNLPGDTYSQITLLDIIIPSDFPFAIDDTMIIRLVFDYPVGSAIKSVGPFLITDVNGSNGVTNFEASVLRIIGNKVRIKVRDLTDPTIGIHGTSWARSDTSDPSPNYFSKFTDRVTQGDGATTGTGALLGCFHLMFLHPYVSQGDYVFYETGLSFPILNPGQSNRAFPSTSIAVPGDTYLQAYTSFNYPEDQYNIAFPLSVQNEPPASNGITYNSMSALTNKRGKIFISGVNTDIGKPVVTINKVQERSYGNIVRWTDPYVANSNINGFGIMQAGNKYSIPIERGDVIKLVSTSDNILLAIHARAQTSLYVNVRIIQSRQDAQVVTSDQVIGDNRPVSGDYGTINPESVVCNDGYRVYGFDLTAGEPWRKSLDGLTLLADTYRTKKWFKYKSELLKQAKQVDPTLDIKIIGAFDPYLHIFFLTFKQVTYTNYPVSVIIPAETIGFRDTETNKGWMGFFDFVPDWYSFNGSKLVSVKNQKLWEHDSDFANCGVFYGTPYASRITIVSKLMPDSPKAWDNIGVHSEVAWTVISAITESGHKTDMIPANFTERDGIFYADFLKDTTTPARFVASKINAPVWIAGSYSTGDLVYVPQTDKIYQSTVNANVAYPPGSGNWTDVTTDKARLNGEILTGQVLSITLENSSLNQITLATVYVGFSPVMGHLMVRR